MAEIRIVRKEIYNLGDKQWIIYTNSHNSMQSLEFKREIHSIINQIVTYYMFNFYMQIILNNICINLVQENSVCCQKLSIPTRSNCNGLHI